MPFQKGHKLSKGRKKGSHNKKVLESNSLETYTQMIEAETIPAIHRIKELTKSENESIALRACQVLIDKVIADKKQITADIESNIQKVIIID